MHTQFYHRSNEKTTARQERAGAMLFAVITALLFSATRTDALFTVTMPPPDVPTFEVTIAGDAPFFAGIRINGTWITDYSAEIKPTEKVEFVVDSPFYTTAPFSVTMRHAQIKYEAPAMRRARLETIWTGNGYVFLDTASGWKPIRKEDIELAQRARKMADIQKERAVANFAASKPTAMETSPGALSAKTLLVFRAAIILLGCLISGVALKLIWRKEANWKALE